MARRKKSIFDMPKTRRKKGKSTASLFGSTKSRRKKGKSTASLFGSTKGRRAKGKSIASLFGNAKGKKSRKGEGLFSGLGNAFGGIFSRFGGFGGFGSTEYPDSPTYIGMRSYLEKHDMSTRDPQAILFYIMHFDGEGQVKSILADLSSHGFGSARKAAWAYSQWEKYQSNRNFREAVGMMGLPGHTVEGVEGFMRGFFGGVPKGVYWFLQDRYDKIKKGLSSDNDINIVD